MDCICLHLKIECRSCAGGVSGVANFNTTNEQLLIKPRLGLFMQAVLPGGFPLCQVNFTQDFDDLSVVHHQLIHCIDFQIA